MTDRQNETLRASHLLEQVEAELCNRTATAVMKLFEIELRVALQQRTGAGPAIARVKQRLADAGLEGMFGHTEDLVWLAGYFRWKRGYGK